jgi:hypothetical protein
MGKHKPGDETFIQRATPQRTLSAPTLPATRRLTPAKVSDRIVLIKTELDALIAEIREQIPSGELRTADTDRLLEFRNASGDPKGLRVAREALEFPDGDIVSRALDSPEVQVRRQQAHLSKMTPETPNLVEQSKKQ